MIPAIHPDVRLIYCFKNYTLACLTDVTYRICDCYFKCLELDVVSLGLSWRERCDGITPSQHFCACWRVNERRLPFEPESRAIISLSSNMPTSANDGRICGGGEHDCPCLHVCCLKMVAGKIINSQKEKKNDSKKWLQHHGHVDEVTHQSEDDDVGGGHVFWFYTGEQWAFNMQLRICMSVSPSLMSCCFCSLSGGRPIIRHARRVPRRRTTGYLMFLIIRETGLASLVDADLKSPILSFRS